MRLGKRIGVDVGDVRIGVAVCDPDGILATLKELVREADAVECVVGLPISLSGREGPAAVKVRTFCAQLATAIDPVPIRLFDERMSTMTANSLLREGGRSGASTRSIIDQAAATVILQTALDAERTRGSAPGEIFVRTDE